MASFQISRTRLSESLFISSAKSWYVLQVLIAITIAMHLLISRALKGAGTYGVVKSATMIRSGQQVAVKIILKKGVRNNEQMVYDEFNVLQKLSHPHIVKFVDWFESKVIGS